MIKELFFWERDFTRKVLRLAIPVAAQCLVTALMQIIDNVMIGQLGEAKLAGVTQANRITFLFQLAMFGAVSGASILVAQYWGRRDMKNIHSLLGVGLITAIGLAALFALPAMIVPEALLKLLINDAEAVAEGAKYLRIVALVYFVQALSLMLSAVLKSTEKVFLPMWAGIAAIASNTLLNCFLIFGLAGMPRLEVRGAALATLIGALIELALLIGVSYSKGYAIAVKPAQIKPPSGAFVLRYYKVVLPVMANEMLWSLGMVMYSVAYGQMGASAVSAISIFNNVEQLASVVMRGATTACAVIIGTAIGAGCTEEAQLNAKRMLAGNIVLGIVAGLLVSLFAGNIADFYKVSEATRASARQIITYYGLFLWLNAANSVLIVGVMRAGGDVLFSMVLDVLFLWIVGVPLVFLASIKLGWPVERVYLLTIIESVIKLVIGIWRIKSKKWINNLVEEN